MTPKFEELETDNMSTAELAAIQLSRRALEGKQSPVARDKRTIVIGIFGQLLRYGISVPESIIVGTASHVIARVVTNNVLNNLANLTALRMLSENRVISWKNSTV